MSGQGIALCVIAGLAVLCAAGVTAAARMRLKGAPAGGVVLMLGPSVTLGIWALAGIAWYLSGGVVS